ncbi:MAG: nucleotidyl transferase AbiEii/AbiGii toxin family protein [Ignavibacteriales bacterium]|nr:nucleotidyl transferase AbiEii/AbiGii toxin family protein [Ignavibacteriales bacterium]
MEYILKPWQQQILLAMVTEERLNDFYLSGRTALAAYYIHHRISDDLDFFSQQEIDVYFVQQFATSLKEIIGARSVRYSRLYDRNQFFYTLENEEAKIEFTKYPFPLLEIPHVIDGIRVDSKYDIAVNKLTTILQRFDPKDFVDLYFLLSEFSLIQLRQGVEKKFGMKVDALFLGSELGKVRRIVALPKMLKELSVEQMKDFFKERIKSLADEVVE